MPKMRPFYLALLLLLTLPLPAVAKPERITVTHSYSMGDSESRNQARAQCLAEAKRKIAEQAGAYVEVLSKTENFQIDKDEVLSFAAAIVRVRVEKEEMAMDGQGLVLTLTVSGEVDAETVRHHLEKLAAKRLEEQQGGIPLTQTAPPPAPPVAKNEYRAPVGKEKASPSPVAQQAPAPVPAANPYAAKARLTKSLDEMTAMCVELTDTGMTKGEVEHLLGAPRIAKTSSRYTGYQYGRVWVVFRDDIVSCLRSRLEYRPQAGGDIHCEGFAFNFLKR